MNLKSCPKLFFILRRVQSPVGRESRVWLFPTPKRRVKSRVSCPVVTVACKTNVVFISSIQAGILLEIHKLWNGQRFFVKTKVAKLAVRSNGLFLICDVNGTSKCRIIGSSIQNNWRKWPQKSNFYLTYYFIFIFMIFLHILIFIDV